MRAQEMRELRREVGRERAAHWFHCGAVLGWGELVWVGVCGGMGIRECFEGLFMGLRERSRKSYLKWSGWKRFF